MAEQLGRVGNAFMLYVNTAADGATPEFTQIGGQRGFSSETSREMIDLSHKGSDHTKSGYGRQDTSASLEGIVMEGDLGYDALEDAINNSKIIMIELRDAGQPYQEAEVLISSLSKEYPDNDAVTASAELQLNSPLARSAKTATSLAAAPADVALAVAGTQQITATMTYDDGTTQDVTSSAAFSSSDATIASVSAGGLITAEALGSATIAVSESGQSATVSVTVS